jgi:hypothetical protein
VAFKLQTIPWTKIRESAVNLFIFFHFCVQDNYPERLHKLLIVNTPTFFKSCWEFVKPYLDPRTQAKIQVLRHNDFSALQELVDAENLPDFLGDYQHHYIIKPSDTSRVAQNAAVMEY